MIILESVCDVSFMVLQVVDYGVHKLWEYNNQGVCLFLFFPLTLYYASSVSSLSP